MDKNFATELKKSLQTETSADYLIADGATFSYAQTDLIASELANLITSIVKKDKTIIGLYFNDKLKQIFATWACIIANQAFFPINSNTTKTRLNQSLCSCDLILTDSLAIAELLKNDGFNKILDEKDIFILENKLKNKIEIPEEACYLLQTSGSTGLPKIVIHSYESCFTFSSWASEITALSSADTVLSISPLFFDMSIFDIFSVALKKAKLHVPSQHIFMFPKDTIETICTNNITTLYLTPTLLERILSVEIEKKMNSVNKIILAGENLEQSLLDKTKEKLESSIFNFYGPTETNVCLFADLTKLKSVSIGSACPYAEIKQLEDSGEILVRGATLALGYLDQDISQDMVQIEDHAYYKTGDFAKQSPSGYIYLGRKDSQVKINGHRVSLVEIETLLTELYPKIAMRMLSFEKNIYLLILSEEIIDLADFKKNLAAHLPGYSIPLKIFQTKEKDYQYLGDTNKFDYRAMLAHLLKKSC